jgi:hypothetical protein
MGNVILIQIFMKDGRKKDSKIYRDTNIPNTCYKIYSKIHNMELQVYSQEFITET